MHEQLADAYRASGIDPEHEQVKLRVPAIETWAKRPTLEQVLDAARLYRRTLPAESPFRSQFTSTFVASDATFRTKGNENELLVLAGASLAHFLRKAQNERGDAAALAVVCSRAASQSATGANPDLERLSDQHLADRSVAVRAIASSSTGLKDRTINAIKKLPETMAGSDLKAAGDLLAPILSDVLNFSVSVTQAIQRATDLQRESSDVVWWLFAGRSSLLGQSFASTPSSIAPLVFAWELLERTRFVPGFLAAGEFLSSALQLGRPSPLTDLSIFDAVEALPDNLLRRLDVSLPQTVARLTPCLSAIALRREHPSKVTWQGAHSSSYGQQGTRSFPPAILARQCYEELTLVRSLGAWSAE